MSENLNFYFQILLGIVRKNFNLHFIVFALMKMQCQSFTIYQYLTSGLGFNIHNST